LQANRVAPRACRSWIAEPSASGVHEANAVAPGPRRLARDSVHEYPAFAVVVAFADACSLRYAVNGREFPAVYFHGRMLL